MKNEVASELPPKLETELSPLNDEQRKAYKALAEGGILEHGNNLKKLFAHPPCMYFLCLPDCDKHVATLPYCRGGNICPHPVPKAIY